MARLKSSLSPADKLILDSYKMSMEGLAAYLGDAFEFVLHDLDDLDHSAVKIINGAHSGRKEGAPITDLALSMLEKISAKKDSSYIAYHSKDRYGKPVKSLTLAIFGERNRTIGLLCINFYLDTPLSAFLQSLLPHNQVDYISENFINNSDELIGRALKKTKEEVFADDTVLVSQKNREIITLLYHQGIFKLKNAVAITSKDLAITRNTIYMHLRRLEKG
jgi:predicted transcriptional regulator YheO